MTDLFGYPLAVGDEVVYTTGAQSNTHLERGSIIDIQPRSGWAGTHNKALIRTASGRRATNWRSSNELVAVNPIRQSSPELFI